MLIICGLTLSRGLHPDRIQQDINLRRILPLQYQQYPPQLELRQETVPPPESYLLQPELNQEQVIPPVGRRYQVVYFAVRKRSKNMFGRIV